MSERPARKQIEPLEARRLFTAGADPYGAGAAGIPAGWQPTFVDDFDGTSLDTSKWFVREGLREHTVTNDPRPDVTSAQSVSVGGGDLKLTVFSTPEAHNAGWIQTKRADTDGVIADDVRDTKFEQSFGYWEARIKFSNGMPGAWSAFWVHSYQMESGPGSPDVIGTEMDVVESAQWVERPGNDSLVKSTIHYNGYASGNAIGNRGDVSGTVADYHVYGMKWARGGISFYVDGRQLGPTLTDPAVISSIRQGIIFSNEVTTNWGWAGGIPTQGYGTPATSTTYMKVDYVKVWGDPTAPPPRTPVPSPNDPINPTPAPSPFPLPTPTPLPSPTPVPDPEPAPTPSPTTVPIRGQLYNDRNRNGRLDRGERGIAGRTVYVDLDRDGLLSINEPRAIADVDGFYSINDVPTGAVYQVRQVVPPGWTQTRPTAGLAFNVSLYGAAGPIVGIDFGSYGPSIIDSPATPVSPTTPRYGTPLDPLGTRIGSLGGGTILEDIGR